MTEGFFGALKPYLPMLIAAAAYTVSFGVAHFSLKLLRAKNSK